VDDWGHSLKSQEYCAVGLEAAWQERLRLVPAPKYESEGDMMGESGPSGANRIKPHVMSSEGKRSC
jgi:hypothetical protein